MRASMRTMLAVVVLAAALLATASRVAGVDASGPKLSSLELLGRRRGTDRVFRED